MLKQSGDEAFMALAIEQARIAADEGDVPVGAVVVAEDRVIAAAHNRPISLSDPTAHAEILAIRQAAKALSTYRLTGATIYVTLEPCVMCVGAMIHARVVRLKFGARDPKAGALGSVYDLGRDGRLNHQLEVSAGLMEPECAAILREFFRTRR
ncbi:MAG: tRNA adenosine(34) deaminase TadA [Candidatus Binatales bacterium]